MICKGKAMCKDSKIRKTMLEHGRVSKILKCSSQIITSH